MRAGSEEMMRARDEVREATKIKQGGGAKIFFFQDVGPLVEMTHLYTRLLKCSESAAAQMHTRLLKSGVLLYMC